MKNMKHIILLLVCTVAVAFAAPSIKAKTKKSALTEIQQPMLWEITGNGLKKPSWLFGTIHIGDVRITGGNTNEGITTSKPVNKAFGKADNVFVELDASDPKIIGEAMKLSMLPKNKTIEDILSAETVKLTKKAIEHTVKQIPLLASNPQSSEILYMQFSRMKPIMLAVALKIMPIMMKMQSPPLDIMICKKAKISGKKLLSLETSQQQMASFEVLSPDEQQQSLQATCKDIVSGESNKHFTELVNAYIRGNIKKIKAILDKDKKREVKLVGQKIIDKFYGSVLYKRNDWMAKKVKDNLVGNPNRSFFIAVGFAHMIGKTGVVEQLKQAGYTVKRITTK